MWFNAILWDRDDDPHGNVAHILRHGVTKAEVEEALANATDFDTSRMSGRPVAFGETSGGRYLIVAYEMKRGKTVYPITAYDVDRPRRRRKE